MDDDQISKKEILDIMRFDYSETSSVAGRLDFLCFAIRGWAVSTTAAIAAVSITTNERNVLWTTILPVALFWALDVYYEELQSRYAEHLRQLELLIQKGISGRDVVDEYTFGHVFTVPLHEGGRERLYREMKHLISSLPRRYAAFAFYGVLLLLPAISIALVP